MPENSQDLPFSERLKRGLITGEEAEKIWGKDGPVGHLKTEREELSAKRIASGQTGDFEDKPLDP